MDENLNQTEQDTTEVSASGLLSNQDRSPVADWAYEETHVPYLPLPSASPPQKNTSSGANNTQSAVPPSSSLPADSTEPKAGRSGGGVLLAVILGALLGGVLSLVTGGSLLLWGSIGALVGGGIALLPQLFSEEAGSWLLLEGVGVGLDEVFNCCQISALLVIGGVVTIGGLLLWQNLFLTTVVGASIIVMMLIGWSFALLKRFLNPCILVSRIYGHAPSFQGVEHSEGVDMLKGGHLCATQRDSTPTGAHRGGVSGTPQHAALFIGCFPSLYQRTVPQPGAVPRPTQTPGRGNTSNRSYRRHLQPVCLMGGNVTREAILQEIFLGLGGTEHAASVRDYVQDMWYTLAAL